MHNDKATKRLYPFFMAREYRLRGKKKRSLLSGDVVVQNADLLLGDMSVTLYSEDCL